MTLRQVVGVGAAILFVVGGVRMLGVESVSGDTIFEEFFHAMAFVSFGLAAYALGRLVIRPEEKNAPPSPAQPEGSEPPVRRDAKPWMPGQAPPG
jgi:hypothetical protein